MKTLIKQNYKTTVNRGLITPYTTDKEFIDKIKEETNELEFELSVNNFNESMIELADIILVCLNFAEHKGVDIIQVMRDKIKYNEIRKD